MTGSTSRPGPPAWFARAVAERPDRGEVDVAGARIRYRAWGDADRPGLVLVHAASAHSGWWDHLAPALASHRVVALDLSGHGDSGHRDDYDMDGWAEEIVAVAGTERLHRPVVVGHSMGGRAAVTTALRHPDAVAAVVCVDTPLTRRSRGPRNPPADRADRPVYPTIEEAVARFRTRPQTGGVPDHLRERIARDSVRRVDGGWTWKADQGVFGRGQRMQDLLPLVGCPLALLRGDQGLVPTDMAAEMSRLVRHPAVVVELPEAGHHPMLDAPLTLLTALRTLLAVWPTGGPA